MESTSNLCNNIVYISNFPKSTEKLQLQKLLQPFGKLLSLHIIRKQQFAFAFAEFDDIRDAVYAVKQLNQKMFDKMNLKVQFRKQKEKQDQQQIPLKLKSSQIPHKKSDSSQLTSTNSSIESNSNIPNSKSLKQRNNQNEKYSINQIKYYQRLKQSKNNCKQNKSVLNSIQKQRRKRDRSRQRQESRSRSRQKISRLRPLKRIKRNDIRQQCRTRTQYQQGYRKRQQLYKQQEQFTRISNSNSIIQIASMIKNLQKGIKRIQQKFQDFLYDYQYDQKYLSKDRRY